MTVSDFMCEAEEFNGTNCRQQCSSCRPTEATPQGQVVAHGLSFQKRVLNWLMECFSNEVCRDGVERNHRFLEELLELVQSLGCTRSEAHQLVDYVFGRPVGEPFQELGGVMVTMSALASCHDMDFEEAAETELARVWTKIEKIRAKQLAKPKHSPLPEAASPPTPAIEAEAGEFVLVPREVLATWRDRFLGYAPDGTNWNYAHLLEAIDGINKILAAAPAQPSQAITEDQIARVIHKVANDWIRPGLPFEPAKFDDLSERDKKLHFDYANAILNLLRSNGMGKPNSS